MKMPSVTVASVNVPGYEQLRSQRKKGKKANRNSGGVLVLYRSKFLNPTMPGFQKLIQARGGGRNPPPPLLTPLAFIRTKPNFVWANTIL